MAECSQLDFELPGFNWRKIEGNFEGGNVSSDGGLVVLRQVDRWLGLTQALAKRLPDQRDPDKIEHSLKSMLRPRIYDLALGYEDLNDHDSLRKDLLWQTATERTEELASCSTLCRLENRAGRKEAWLMHEVLFEQFVNSFESAPRELILDLTVPTIGRTDSKRVGTSTVITMTFAFYPSRCSAASDSYSANCAKATSIRLSMLGQS